MGVGRNSEDKQQNIKLKTTEAEEEKVEKQLKSHSETKFKDYVFGHENIWSHFYSAYDLWLIIDDFNCMSSWGVLYK